MISSVNFAAARTLRCVLNRSIHVSSYITASKSGAQGQGKKSGSGGPTTSTDSKNLDPPQFIFKDTNPNELGPGAGKGKKYKNPEYFSYHVMSYADMDVVMKNLRCPQPSRVKK